MNLIESISAEGEKLRAAMNIIKLAEERGDKGLAERASIAADQCRRRLDQLIPELVGEE